MGRRRPWCVVLAMLGCSIATNAYAYGEEVDTFPNWGERVVHEWANRARTDPQGDIKASCQAGSVGEIACYTPLPPYYYDGAANHAARFHSDEGKLQNYPALDHSSHCVIVPNIASLYPDKCNGAATCACQNACLCTNGPPTCSVACASTDTFARVQLFGVQATAEGIAGATDPDQGFYSWLCEPYAPTTCGYNQGPPTNGHRFAIVDGRQGGFPTTGVGYGTRTGQWIVGDYSAAAPPSPAPKIPSGSHYPRQAATVDAWANFYDTAAPKSALVNVDGTCTPMMLGHGTATNGAYHAQLTGVGSGCHRYVFLFTDSSGAIVTHPDTGSLGIGPEGSCADWDATKPATGPSCNCAPKCSGKQCGDDGCGGSCGNCAAGAMCSASGQCPGGATAADGGTTHGGTGDGTGNGDGGGVGSGSDGGALGASPGAGVGDTGGCGCRIVAVSSTRSSMLAFVGVGAALALFVARRRRSRRSS